MKSRPVTIIRKPLEKPNPQKLSYQAYAECMQLWQQAVAVRGTDAYRPLVLAYWSKLCAAEKTHNGFSETLPVVPAPVLIRGGGSIHATHESSYCQIFIATNDDFYPYAGPIEHDGCVRAYAVLPDSPYPPSVIITLSEEHGLA